MSLSLLVKILLTRSTISFKASPSTFGRIIYITSYCFFISSSSFWSIGLKSLFKTRSFLYLYNYIIGLHYHIIILFYLFILCFLPFFFLSYIFFTLYMYY